MAIQVDVGRGLRVTYVWVTYVWQILGYPFLAGKPPGVPGFGHCSKFNILQQWLSLVSDAKTR